MKIPPILTLAEDSSLLENLKGLALAQKALATYATAEGNKISALTKRLEEIGDWILSPGAMETLERNASYAVQNVQSIQSNLQSHLINILAFIQAESLYELLPLPPTCTCDIVAHGKGAILNKQDSCYGGRGILKRAILSISKGKVIHSTINYHLETTDFCYHFESISEGLQIDSFGKLIPHPSLTRPNIVLITGYGVITKYFPTQKDLRKLCWFALTLWDYGPKVKQDKFRMMFLINEHCLLTFDSGIIF